MPGRPGRRPGINLTQDLADKLRELIHISGEWQDGRDLPAEEKLGAEHDMSRTTVRRAIQVLVGEGLLQRGQGRVARVCIREPAYWLVIDQDPTHGVAEPPCWRPGTKRTWHEDVAAVPRGYARLLGLESRPVMRQRTMRLFVDGEPVLTSTSYLPADLAADGEGWQNVAIGQLALTGYDVTAAYIEDYERMPAPTERAALGMPKDVLMRIVSRPCRVRMPDRDVKAGVIVLARSDRVRSRQYGPVQLTLE